MDLGMSGRNYYMTGGIRGVGRAAVLNLGRSLAIELAPNVCINVINLRAIATEHQLSRHQESGSDLSFDEWCTQKAQRRGVLLNRLGTAAEVALVVALLLSPLTSYVTGASIDVAGGFGCYL